jgi:hypothetical protein
LDRTDGLRDGVFFRVSEVGGNGSCIGVFPEYRIAAGVASLATDGTVGGYGDVAIDVVPKALFNGRICGSVAEWLCG